MTEVPDVVTLVRDPGDLVAASGPATWAEAQLADALSANGVQVERDNAAQSQQGSVIRLCGFDSPPARDAFATAGISAPTTPESLALLPTQDGTLVATGKDPRGLVYAILDLTDRVRNAVGDPIAALRASAPILQQPANPIRGIARLFVSDVEDLPWFTNRDFWQAYLTELVTHRFNRIHLAFGIGHDFLRNVIDAYFLFPYPFLVDVPGYNVHASGVSDAERARNLQLLRFASDEAASRGLHFQLGIWTQAYAWLDSPHATHIIEGLTAENHAAYCRDAVRAVLQACPSIAGVTFRVHGESGVPEGNYEFWREVFRGVTDCGRRVDLDLHPKGVGPEMIDVGLETGLPLTLSPKFTAEHMGLPGHQLQIRELERRGEPHREPDAFVEQLMNRSAADLRYTRYGNADFLRDDRRYGVFYRMWPGTQRLLLWGDPSLAAGYGRAGSFCGALGIEFCEPLSFKGRRGSGLPGGRDAYADHSLQADGGADWQKFRLTYRILGRLVYDPEEEAAVWGRAFAHEFGPECAPHVEAALANASRILPLVTSAYHPSAANNRYWPEVYTNLPIVDEQRSHPYRDTPSPRRFGSASPLDPGLFSGVDEFVRETTHQSPSGRVSPIRVARTLDALAAAARRALDSARATGARPTAPAFRRLEIDVSVQAELGAFFAAKLRAGVAYSLWETTHDRARLQQALEWYQAARAAWLRVVEHGRAYRDDISVGGEAWLRGNWSDRLAAIDGDLADMQARFERVGPVGAVAPPLDELDPPRAALIYAHTPPPSMTRGEPLRLVISIEEGGRSLEAELHYRHVNQAEAYCTSTMAPASDGCFTATVPKEYTNSPFPLQYFFVLRSGTGAWRIPELAEDLANQPYWVVRS